MMNPPDIDWIRRFSVDFLDVYENRVRVVEDQFDIEVMVKESNSNPISMKKLQELQEELDSRLDDDSKEIPVKVDVSTVSPKPDFGSLGSTSTDESTGADIEIEQDLGTTAAKINGTIGDAIKKSFKQITADMNEAMKSSGIEPGQSSEDSMPQIKHGDKVKAEMVNGSKIEGEVVGVLTQTAGEYTVDGTNTTLVEYWKKSVGKSIASHEAVYDVKVDEGKVYSFPESKVKRLNELPHVSGVGENKADALRKGGYLTIDALRAASQEELAEVDGIGMALAAKIKADVGSIESAENLTHVGYECPHCDETFTASSDEAIEGEDEEMYCSLECLNEAVA